MIYYAFLCIMRENMMLLLMSSSTKKNRECKEENYYKHIDMDDDFLEESINHNSNYSWKIKKCQANILL